MTTSLDFKTRTRLLYSAIEQSDYDAIDPLLQVDGDGIDAHEGIDLLRAAYPVRDFVKNWFNFRDDLSRLAERQGYDLQVVMRGLLQVKPHAKSKATSETRQEKDASE